MNDNNKRAWNLLWAILAVCAFYIASNLLMLACYVAIPKWLIAVKPEQAGSYTFIMDIIISIVLLALSFLAYKMLGEKAQDKKAPLCGKTLIQCAVMGIAVFGVNAILNMVFQPAASAGGSESLVSMLLSAVLFAPLIEEFFFRGVVYNLLNRFKSGWVPVLLSAAIFGIYHMDVYQAIYTGILGLVLALVYQRTENILYPIAIHMANNACACLMASVIPESAQTPFGIAAAVMMLPAVVLLVRANRSNRAASEIVSDTCR